MRNSDTIEKILTREAFFKKKPISVTIELLPLCNMNCDMCYIRLSNQEMKNEGSLLTLNEWLTIAKQLKDFGVLFLLITGGEPLMYPHFKELYMELKKLGFIITLNTNGTLINDHWINFFKKYKPRRINITLYGSSNETYNKLCHYSDGFTQTINNITKLIQNNLPLKINGSIVKYNMNELDQLYAICKEYNVPIHVDTYMIPSLKQSLLKNNIGTRLSPVEMANTEIKVLQNELSDLDYITYIKNTVTELNKQTTYPNGISCQAGNTSFAINWKGFMTPCISMKGIEANLVEISLNDAWNYISTKSKELQLNGKCSTCKYRVICKTCVATAYLETNKYDEIPSYLCEYSKAYAKLLQEEYNRIHTTKAP